MAPNMSGDDGTDDESAADRVQKPAVRHAEARRGGTCRFADRVAAASVAHYRRHVPIDFRRAQPQACLATVVAYDAAEDGGGGGAVTVLAMGVGTKFLRESVIRDQHRERRYGERVRDCHAEVLARRAFRRHLTDAILGDVRRPGAKTTTPTVPSILQRVETSPIVRYRLKPSVTLHMYCSSTPCGNSALKKFATMQKEVFLGHLDEWPPTAHEPTPGHSIPLGQFALLVKKDNSAGTSKGSETATVLPNRPLTLKQHAWPVHCRTDWCPAGTTPVWSSQGSLHTCSDKIARWNILGWQGSLLSSLLQQPLYVSSLTVGRKFSSACCRRAVCCRLVRKGGRVVVTTTTHPPSPSAPNGADGKDEEPPQFRLHHPAVMGTSVYMDETGVVDTADGSEVRFHSPLSWASWLQFEGNHVVVECIDGSTGFASPLVSGVESETIPSRLSTADLVDSFMEVRRSIGDSLPTTTTTFPVTLDELRSLKISVSCAYEQAKNGLLTQHPVLRDWKRRQKQHSTNYPRHGGSEICTRCTHKTHLK